MRYLGGKGRLGKRVALSILSSTPRRGLYLEPFLGGGHSFEQIAPHFALPHAGDVHQDLVLMWRAAARGWVPPQLVTEAEYRALRDSPPSATRGFVGFGCSFAGMWFKCPARHRKGVPLEYDDVAEVESRVVVRTARPMARARIEWASYDQWDPLVAAGGDWVVYGDPPYRGTATYDGADGFDSDRFWWFMDRWHDLGAHVFVTEYSAPPHWRCAGQTDLTCQVAGGGNRVERLFVR